MGIKISLLNQKNDVPKVCEMYFICVFISLREELKSVYSMHTVCGRLEKK